jgi:CHASE2 domain-containing sensor protein
VNTTTSLRPNWLLFWIGIVAFVGMAITVATQAVPPPIPESVPIVAGILIIGFLLIAMATLTAFLWEVLNVDSRHVG